MANAKLKETMKSRGVCQWEVAEFLNITESRFSRLMRHELDPDLALSALSAVDQIAANKGRAKFAGSTPVVINK